MPSSEKEADAFIEEAAMQYGFEPNENGDGYTCTSAQVVAFAKACKVLGLVATCQALVG